MVSATRRRTAKGSSSPRSSARKATGMGKLSPEAMQAWNSSSLVAAWRSRAAGLTSRRAAMAARVAPSKPRSEKVTRAAFITSSRVIFGRLPMVNNFTGIYF